MHAVCMVQKASCSDAIIYIIMSGQEPDTQAAVFTSKGDFGTYPRLYRCVNTLTFAPKARNGPVSFLAPLSPFCKSLQ